MLLHNTTILSASSINRKNNSRAKLIHPSLFAHAITEPCRSPPQARFLEFPCLLFQSLACTALPPHNIRYACLNLTTQRRRGRRRFPRSFGRRDHLMNHDDHLVFAPVRMSFCPRSIV
ncbi:hypothetical protein PVAP13_2NG497206 [Panicum virgatum]|uniref:Uncharacterized protein n=1 Tax=Panicum virgatum TaxID=38727 RepID=A0A8T0VJL6_PANVG|nr:hypothetical protein PVAP13_2NG497206 [Panicum virgatum]